jgi:hypothetical protein
LSSEELNFPPNSFEWFDAAEFNQISPYRESNRALDTFSEQLAPSLPDQQFSSNFASSIDFLGADTSVEQYPITAPGGKHFTAPLHDEDSVVGLTIGANPQAGHTAPFQAPKTSSQPENLPQNFDGEMICDHLDCISKNLIFTNTRELS